MTSIRDIKPITQAQFESADDELARLRDEVAAWRRAYEKGAKREIGFGNSAKEVEPLYTALDVGAGSAEELGVPGVFPYTRGIHPTGYRGKLWTMRQFAGFGTPEDTNARYKSLLAAGGTGLSVAFDLPTLMGRDPDHELSLGEVGRGGVRAASPREWK